MNIIKTTILIGLTPFLLCADDFITTNLLTNPGADATVATTGWTFTNYGTIDQGTFDPGIDPLSGSTDFSGGVGNGYTYANIYQIVNIGTGVGGAGATSADIAAGLYADVSFWEQSLNQGDPSDDARIVLDYYNASDQLLAVPGGLDGVYAVTSTVDSNGGYWTNGTGSFLVPAGTTYIVYYMQFLLNKGVNIDSFIDDNSLTLSATSGAPTPGAPVADCATPLGLLNSETCGEGKSGGSEPSTPVTTGDPLATPEPSSILLLLSVSTCLGIGFRRRLAA